MSVKDFFMLNTAAVYIDDAPIRNTMPYSLGATPDTYIPTYLYACAKYISVSGRNNKMCDKTPQGILIPK